MPAAIKKDTLAALVDTTFKKVKQSLKKNFNFQASRLKKDTIAAAVDTTITSVKQSLKRNFDTQISRLKKGFDSKQETLGSLPPKNLDSTLMHSYDSKIVKSIFSAKPFFLFRGGNIAYNLNYRSNIDTPFIEKNILQHNSYGSFNFSVGNLPFKLNYLLRRSNSNLFKNINDVQLEYDSRYFNNNITRS